MTTVTEHTPQPARCGVTPTLRGYQTTAAHAMNDAIFAGERPLLVCPTGGGKTEIFLWIATHTDARVIIAVHRNELVEQISMRMGDTPHGIIKSGHVPNLHARIQIASIGTLVNRTHLYSPDLIIFDEAHHAVSNTWLRIMAAYPSAAIMGVTATPCRLDGTGLRDAGFTMLIETPDTASLTQAGYLCPARVYVPNGGISVEGARRKYGDFVKSDLEKIMSKPCITGNAIDHYGRFAPGLPAVVFCVSVAKAEETAEQFRQAGWRAASIDGTMSTLERRQRLSALRNGNLQLLMSCDLVSEGVDVPAIVAGIFLRHTDSLGLWRQQVGRCLRTCPGKTEAILLDHVGNTLRHGLPDAPQQWTLDGETRTRAQRAADDAPVRICLECFRAHVTAPECPYCGFVYPAKPREIAEQPGELSLLDAAWAATKPVMPGRMEEFQAASLADFQRIAEERGYKAGWAYHRWQAKQKQRASA